jgi:two-component system, NarL family, sensor kinase
MFNVVYIASIIVATVIIFFVISIVLQQRKVSKWQQARIAAEINTLESERKRIAGDLHDELGPMLSAIKLQINHLEPNGESETAALEKSSVQIDSIMQRFREISYDLLPNTLVRKGFINATKEFVGKLESLNPLKINFETDDFSLAATNEVNLYRIVQEIIQNTIKHSRATCLNIRIQKKEKSILLHTKDDGIGFNYSEKSLQSKGIGLLSLQSRAQLLGGQLIVDTQPGAGTSFQLEIPM